MTQRGHFIFRGLGAALAFVIFASPLFEAFHAATTNHVTCPEDGQLIDAHASSNATSPDAVPFGDAPGLAWARDSAPVQHSRLPHDHCAIAMQAHVRARVTPPARIVVSGSPGIALVNPAPDAPTLASLAVYRLAPKASPPLI